MAALLEQMEIMGNPKAMSAIERARAERRRTIRWMSWMRLKITIEGQPLEFILRQPPENRKRLREALRAVERGSAFPEPLEDELEGFYKLKVERFRLILQSVTSRTGPGFRVVFAERRKVAYEIFSQLLGLE